MRLILPPVLAALALCACSPAPPAKPPTQTPGAGAIDPSRASVSAPLYGAETKSPLTVAGIAPSNWFFEASFPVTLVDDNNQTLAQAPAQAQSDWTVQGPVPFKAQLNFLVLQETHATVVLREDMPSHAGAAREVRIPVVLEPGG
jgi:hypothetical protein